MSQPLCCRRDLRRTASITFLLVGLLAAYSDASAAPRLALLVGISDYPQTTNMSWRRLHARSDVEALKQVLIERYAFRESDVLVLQDRAATAQGIRQAFRQHLIEQARPGAVIFFHFSGHGQQVVDQNGDELDGLDETLVPAEATDSRAETGARVNVRDDEIADWLRALHGRMRDPQRPNGKLSGSIVISMDSCFSGTATRGVLLERGRGWDEAIDGPRPTPRSVDALTPQRERMAALRDLDGDYHFLAAAQSDQTAKERSRDGIEMGVYTRALVAALSRANRTTTYRTLRDEIVFEVMAEVRHQVPQLDGELDELLFAGSAPPAEPYLALRTQRGDSLTLSAGTLHLVTAGSVYALHRAGVEPMSAATLLAEARVIAVTAQESTLELLPAWRGTLQPQALRGARAVEKTHIFANTALRVFLSNVPSEIARAIQGREVVLVPSSRSADVWIDADAASSTLRVYRPSSPRPLYTTRFDDIEGLDRIFRAEWRYRQLLELRQDSSAGAAELRVVPLSVELDGRGKLLRAPVERSDAPAHPGKVVALREGDFYGFELANTSAVPLWITVLEMGSDGRIGVAYPRRRSAEPLAPGARRRLSDPAYVFRVGPPFGRSIFKVIATTENIDLSSLMQKAIVLSCPVETKRSLELTRSIAMELAETPATLRTLSQVLLAMTSGRRAGTRGDVAVGSFMVTTSMLDSLTPGPDSGSASDPCAEGARK